MTTTVTRHFVTIDGRWGPRQVHYRRAGRGPAVLLLHQSPQSSREMVELMGQWARHFTVIAPDSPGYGQSDPLGPATVSMDEFAHALVEVADALGLRRFGIYGYHTGSSIGLWLAAAHPARVAALAANGLVNLSDDERRNILSHYLPPVVPSWDGSHLAWLWSRVREQAIFFPWHEHTAAARMELDVPGPDRLHASVLEFIRSGDNYGIAYRAAFESRPDRIVPTLRIPLMVTATPGDPLRAHLQRLGPLPPQVELSPADSNADALQRCLQHLLSLPGDDAPAPVATRPISGRRWSSMLRTASGQVHAQLSLEGRGEPLLLIHGAGESAATIGRLTDELAGERPVIIPDLPGHGESDPPQTAVGPSIAEGAQTALHTLHATGMAQAILAGQGAGAWIALETCRRGSFTRRRLALLDVPWLDAGQREDFRDRGLPAIEPQWHGGHLLLAWHLIRDGRLFFPWFERNRAGARRVEPDLDPARLQLELRSLLAAEGAWQNLWRAALDYPAADALRDLDEGLLGAASTSAWHGPTMAAADLNDSLGRVSLPAAPSRWLPALLGLWN